MKRFSILLTTLLTLLVLTSAGWAALPAQDNFNRTAENPLSDSGKWTAILGFNSLQTNGTQATWISPNQDQAMVWNADTFTADQEAQVDEENIDIGYAGGGVILRADPTRNRNSFYYAKVYKNYGDPKIDLGYQSGGGYSILATITVPSFVVGNKVKIRVTGSNPVILTAFVDYGSGFVQEGSPYSDSTYKIANGSPGIFSYFDGILDNFSANNYSIPAPPTVTTTSVSSITKTTATTGGTITNGGTDVINNYGYVISLTATNAAPTHGGTGCTYVQVGTDNKTGAYSGDYTTLTSNVLTANTQYSINACLYDSTTSTWINGTATSFTTTRDAIITLIRVDGTAISPIDATGNEAAYELDVTKCLNIAHHNSSTFVPDDVIKISDKGGTYGNTQTSVANYLIAPSSGTDGHPIVYEVVTGETPIFDGSYSIENTVATGHWVLWSGGIYRNANVQAKVMWEDGVALHPLTAGYESNLTAGQFCLDSGYLYYYPSTGTPASHILRGMWVNGNPISWATDGVNYTNYAFDIRERSNLDISGLTFTSCGIGHSSNNSSPVATTIKNVHIHDCNFDHTYWAIYGEIHSNASVAAVSQGFEIDHNNISYCNSGISTWFSGTDLTGPHPLNHNVHDNNITNHSMMDNNNDWPYCFQDDGNGASDHEAISFQDPVGCLITDNTISCPTIRGIPGNKYGESSWDIYYATRAIYYWISNNPTQCTGNKVLRNRIIGRYSPAIYLSVLDTTGYNASGGFGDNIYALNVLQCSGADNQYDGIKLRGSNAGNANPLTTPNYLYNNTINYPNGGIPFEIGNGSKAGYFTWKNNIVVGTFAGAKKVFIDEGDTSYFSFGYDCYSPATAGAHDFYYNNGDMAFPPAGGGWQSYGFDVTGSVVADPKLRASDSALTTLSPCKHGGANPGVAIEGITVISGVGQVGIDGEFFDVTNPAMGAYAQPLTLTPT